MADNPAVKQMVDEKIRSRKVMVFSKSGCPYCSKAKAVLESYNLPAGEYEVWEIENDPQCGQIQSYLKVVTGASSVPRVFVNGQCIGGGDDTARMHENGELSKLLSS